MKTPKPKLNLINMKTLSGRVVREKVKSKEIHPLSFLSEDEQMEVDSIGYRGELSNGSPCTLKDYLNSLGRGVFEVIRTKMDDGTFYEEFLVIRATV